MTERLQYFIHGGVAIVHQLEDAPANPTRCAGPDAVLLATGQRMM